MSSAPRDTTLICGSVTSTSTATNAGTELSVQVGYETPAGPRQATRTVTAWDAALRPTRASWATTAGTSLVASTSFDAAGRVKAQGGVGFTAAGVTYSYSALSGLKTSETWALALDGPLTQKYAYTSDGRINSYKRALETTVACTWSAIGNIATVTVGTAKTHLYYDGGNRLTRSVAPSGTTTYNWETTRGLRTGSDGPTQDWTYGYDDDGHLESAAGSGASTATATFAYDANGQRMASHITSGATTSDTTYRYEGITLHALSATAAVAGGSITATWALTYLYDGSGSLYGALYAASDTTAPLLLGAVTTDRGDVVELTDEAGAVFARYDTDVWGAAKSTTVTPTARIDRTTAQRIADRQPLRYAGCCYDASTRLYYLSARYYDAATMQFLTKDPAKADGEESAYQYCGGDPVGKVDPSGHFWKKTHVFGTLYLSGAEIALAASFPVSAWEVWTAHEAAQRKAKTLFRDHGNGDGNGNAFLHAYWNALGVKRLYLNVQWHSVWAARVMMAGFANAHERWEGNRWPAKGMDLANNRTGRIIGERGYSVPDWCLAERVLDALFAHKLHVLKKGKIVPSPL